MSRPGRLPTPRALAAGLLLALTLASAAWAAPTQAPDAARQEQIEQHLQAAKARLKLTPEQEPKLKALLTEEAGKLKAIHDKHAGDSSRAARRAELQEAKTLRQDFRGRLAALLTPEQLREWDRMRDESKDQVREHVREHRHAASGTPP